MICGETVKEQEVQEESLEASAPTWSTFSERNETRSFSYGRGNSQSSILRIVWNRSETFSLIHAPQRTESLGTQVCSIDHRCLRFKRFGNASVPYGLRAPSAANAPRNSRTAVFVSSKFNAEMAHLACFCAFIIASSSTFKSPGTLTDSELCGWSTLDCNCCGICRLYSSWILGFGS